MSLTIVLFNWNQIQINLSTLLNSWIFLIVFYQKMYGVNVKKIDNDP